MGLHYIASGPRGETHNVMYVCSDPRNGHPRCLTNAIMEYVSVQWASVCETVSEFVMGDTVYTIGFTPNDSDASGHVYCGACGDLVSHGDGGDGDRMDGRVCDVDGCTWPEYVTL